MDWSEFIQEHNSVELVNAVYHAPQVLTRADPRLAGPLAAIRKATAERSGSTPEAVP
jgi:hypothetical protein